MRRISQLSVILLLLTSPCTVAQNMDDLHFDQLMRTLGETKADSTRALTYARLAEYYRNWRMDSTLYFGEASLKLSRRIHYPSGEAKALSVLSHYYFAKGELPKGLEIGLEGLRVARQNGLIYDEASLLIRIANVYANLHDVKKAVAYYHQAIAITRDAPDPFFNGAAHWRMADAFAQLDEADSALFYAEKAVAIAKKMGNNFIQQGVVSTLGYAYGKKGYDSLALHYLRSTNSSSNLVMRAIFFKDRSQYNSAIACAYRAYERNARSPAKQTEMTSAALLSELYESRDPAKALRFLKIAQAAKESISGAANTLSIKAIELAERDRQRETQLAEINLRNKIKISAAIGALMGVILLAGILYRNFRKAKENNAQLEQQKNEIHQALSDLRKTQSQLIQSEKMASLGELTAGIAHEIQNPLNFVNNFSEVSNELIDEMNANLASGNWQPATEIGKDVKQNLEKILHHGKRADAIVKGMLQHSRKSSGQKELTDINALCDEYLRLAYHGLRAKDKSFTAKFETHLDPSLPKLNVVPQEIGRVVLNLINNAFYAVSEKQKAIRQQPTANSQQPNAGYEPEVIVSTRNLGSSVEICVKDNGNGMPDHIKGKIFQPFFTTKPTGQGTGLGLSLSYDIVTKGHNGNLKVNTREGIGSEFIISLLV